MGNVQILDHALEQHKDTTASAQRALAAVQQAQQLAASTAEAMRDQRFQMGRVADGMDKVEARGARGLHVYDESEPAGSRLRAAAGPQCVEAPAARLDGPSQGDEAHAAATLSPREPNHHHTATSPRSAPT